MALPGMNVLHSKSVRILSLVLLAQAGVFYGFQRREVVPMRQPLAGLSLDQTAWKNVQEMQIDQETLDVLKADDILSRVYQNRTNGQVATLFIAYFETQRTGKAPHSPKNCLPGAGFVPSQSGVADISIAEEQEPIQVNRYIVSRGQNQSAVLYWYQARTRVIASEYKAKFFTIADAIRFNRSDTALVRVVVGANDGNTEKAVATAESFVQSFFEPLKRYLPA
ncbi:MAG TPA: EpsI family protein [Bryobacteraceae bacterium]|nr:EpsI family protein [Bryobacteraceae bacterium]